MENKIAISPEIREEIEKEVRLVVRRSEEIKIADKDGLEKATDFLGIIKAAQKKIVEAKGSIVRPLNEALANARAFFAPYENKLVEAEGKIKKAMIEFSNKEEKERLAQEAKIADKVDKGTMKFETGAKKVEALEEKKVDKTIESKVGKATFVIRREVFIVNEKEIPREYLVPDMVRIRRVALAGVAIAGIEVREVKTVAGRATGE
jgi:hypothetical protein